MNWMKMAEGGREGRRCAAPLTRVSGVACGRSNRPPPKGRKQKAGGRGFGASSHGDTLAPSRKNAGTFRRKDTGTMCGDLPGTFGRDGVGGYDVMSALRKATRA
ncbi:MAG TPA: hypothetical protein VF352_08615 [Anaerolineales bacterium]